MIINSMRMQTFHLVVSRIIMYQYINFYDSGNDYMNNNNYFYHPINIILSIELGGLSKVLVEKVTSL